MCSRKWRGFCGTMHPISGCFGSIWVFLYRRLIYDWQHMQAITFLPMLVMPFALWYIPESPKWYLCRGYRKQAWDILVDLGYDSVPQEELKAPSITPACKYWRKDYINHVRRYLKIKFFGAIVMEVIAHFLYRRQSKWSKISSIYHKCKIRILLGVFGIVEELATTEYNLLIVYSEIVS